MSLGFGPLWANHLEGAIIFLSLFLNISNNINANFWSSSFDINNNVNISIFLYLLANKNSLINDNNDFFYADKKMHELLNPGGKIAGLLFNFPLTEKGPPFGGSIEEYKSLFSGAFKLKILEKAYNSIKPRANKELFFIFDKK